MALPVVVLDTPDEEVFRSDRPTLKMTGTEADSNELSYEIQAIGTDRMMATHDTTIASMNPYSVDYYGGRLVARVGSSTIVYSDDGITWSSASDVVATSFSTGDERIQVLNGVFYALSTIGIARSSDGDSWTKVWTANSLSGMAYGNGIYVVVSYLSDEWLTSTDGITWTSRSLGGYSSLHSVVFANGRFYGVTKDGATALTSVDGLNWEPGTPLPRPLLKGSQLIAINDVIFASLNWNTTEGFQISRDGGETFSDLGPNKNANSGYVTDVGEGHVGVLYRGGTSYIQIVMRPPYRFPEDVVPNMPVSHNNTQSNRLYISPLGLTHIGQITGESGYHISLFSMMRASSSEDVGFVNTSTPSDLDPFNSGSQVEYKPQIGMRQGGYTWTARAIAPDGENIWSYTPASFNSFSIVSPPNPGIFMQFLT